jgi:hypothetical protein
MRFSTFFLFGLLIATPACGDDSSGSGTESGGAGNGSANGSGSGSGGGGGDGSGSGSGAGSQGSGCKVTLTGAVQAEVTCDSIAGAWDANDDRGAIALAAKTPDGAVISAGIGFEGEPAPGTYQESDADAKTGIQVTSGTQVWLASVDASQPDQGSYTLELTSATEIASGATGKGFEVTGTLDATLEVAFGQGGPVTMRVEFD